jgi:hypothetical protein
MITARQAAAYLGHLTKGVAKTLTDEERKRRSLRLAEARKKRWPKKEKSNEDSAVNKV